MSAYVEHDFDRGFMLDEVRIRKLHEVVAVRLKKLPSAPKLMLKVFRGDSLSYETEDVNVVVGEDNDDWRAVTRIEFLANADDAFNLRLTFSSSRVAINITGDDRDAVFLLFSDVREYLNNEVLSGRAISRNAALHIGMVVMTIIMASLTWSQISSASANKELLELALASDDVLKKLNFIIEERARQSPKSTWSFALLIVMVLTMLLSFGGLLDSLWRFFFPTNMFLFGTRKQTFERQQSLKGKVFWGVFVAFIVSVFAGIILTGWLPSK